MNILNRFLLKHFLRILALSTGAFIGIYLLIDFFEKISDFIDHKATAGDYLSWARCRQDNRTDSEFETDEANVSL